MDSSEDRNGNVTKYHDRSRPLSAEQIAAAEKRRLDCIDCHNRPAHIYLAPDAAVNQSFSAGRLDPSPISTASQHPVDLGGVADRKCETCHKPNEPFKHPINLGDISMFQCVECHPREK